MTEPFLHRSYVFALQPDRRQRKALDRLLEGSRLLYNAALQERRDEWRHACRLASLLGLERPTKAALERIDRESLDERRRGTLDALLVRKAPSFYSQDAGLTLKAQRAALGEVVLDLPSVVRRWALRRVDESFAGFFRRVAAGHTPGFPRFKPLTRWSTFGIEEMNGARFVQPDSIAKGQRGYGDLRLNPVGSLRVRMHRLLPDGAEVRALTLTKSRTDGSWKVSLSCRIPALVGVPTPEMLRNVADSEVLGLDVGILSLVATDCGYVAPPAMPARKAAKATRRRQRDVARSRKGSNGRARKVRGLARAKRHEADARRTHSRAQASAVVKLALRRNCRAVGVEDLNLRNLTRSAKGTVEEPGTNVRGKAGLNRSLADAAPGLFLSHVRDGAEEPVWHW